MEIKIENGEELSRLLDVLAKEIVDANIYHRLSCDIESEIKDNKQAFNQSNTFWGLAINALYDAKIIRLCRVYDQEAKSLNLVNLLDTIKLNLHLFENESFRERLQDNAFLDSLASKDRVPSIKQLEEDVEYASTHNLLVRKLMIWRNNIVAHRGAKVSLGKTKLLEDYPLSKDEIENLLDTGFDIYNRYSRLYRASTDSRQIIGHDDYKSLLKFINLGLEKWHADIDRELI